MQTKEITIHLFEDSDGNYQYDIYADKSPEQAAKVDPDDGGICTTDMVNALEMAYQQATQLK